MVVRGEGHIVTRRFLEVICLVHARFESAFVESQVIVLFAGISPCLCIDVRPDLVWITQFVECLIVGCLKVIVDHTTLFLLTQREVMTLKFGLQVYILLVLCVLVVFVAVSLLNELSFSFRDHFLVFIGPDRYICSLELIFDFLTISSLASLLGLSINFRGVKRLSLFHSSVLLGMTELELGLLHAGFELLSVRFLVRRELLLAHVCLIHAHTHLFVVTERKVGFT